MDIMHGEFAVKLARRALERWTMKGEMLQRPECGREFAAKSGVFTTIYTYPKKELRGCIGFPTPVMPLVDAIIESAVSAAQDPRFPDIRKEELKKIIVEVSVLTKPEKIIVKSPEEYAGQIKIGRDGLIIRRGMHSGLLLPQVATEYAWDAKTFLENLCMKASLPPDAWSSPGAEIFRFRSEIFGEKKPAGKIEKM
jgi:hypothetical protein